MLAEMTAQEYIGWVAHLELSHHEQEEAQRVARRGRR